MTWKFSESSEAGNTPQADYNTQGKSMAARIYKFVANKECPTWDDVQGKRHDFHLEQDFTIRNRYISAVLQPLPGYVEIRNH